MLFGNDYINSKYSFWQNPYNEKNDTGNSSDKQSFAYNSLSESILQNIIQNQITFNQNFGNNINNFLQIPDISNTLNFDLSNIPEIPAIPESKKENYKTINEKINEMLSNTLGIKSQNPDLFSTNLVSTLNGIPTIDLDSAKSLTQTNDIKILEQYGSSAINRILFDYKIPGLDKLMGEIFNTKQA